MTSRARPPRPRWLVWAVGFALALGSLVGWSFASAPGSSPDDDFHLGSIWCGLGEIPGRCEAGSEPEWRKMPVAVLAATCHAYRSAEDASCMAVADGDLLQDNSRGNWTGLYPPVYYAVAGLLVGPDVGTTVVLVRVMNSVVFLTVVALLLAIGPPMLRRFAIVAPLVATVPLGMFVIASINPSSWAVTSALAVSGALLLLPRVTGRRQWAAAGLAVGGALLGAGARADSAVTTIVAVAVALVLGIGRDRRTNAFLIAAGAIAVAIGVAFLLSAHQSGAAVTGLDSATAPSLGALLTFAAATFLDIPALLAGVFGAPPLGSLGWFDIPLADWVWVTAGATFVVAIWVALRRASPRRLTAIGLAAAAAFGYALLLQVQAQKEVGDTVQPRYVLPLIVVLAVTALADDGTMRRLDRIGGAQRWLPLAALATANAVALFAVIRRYTVGTGGDALPGPDAGWWWTMPPGWWPVLVWLLAAVAYAALLVVLGRRPAPPVDDESALRGPLVAAPPR